MADLERARAMFFAYDGSTFGMWRNGEIDDYRAFGVPAETEEAWLAAITADRLGQLGGLGSLRTISFLKHHGDLRHLPALVATRPPGPFQDRCAYEELLLRYLDELSVQPTGPKVPVTPTEDLAAGLARVLDAASSLGRAVRSERARTRVATLASGAALREAARAASPVGRWVWHPSGASTEPWAEPVR